MTTARRGRCPICRMDGLPVTDDGVMWPHSDPNPYVERRCPGSGQKPAKETQ